MAGITATSPVKETDVLVLKETIRSQQQLLQKLYAELDVEREVANTATNEALSMILRLQGEKAAMEMEASQYKRMAEEKITHAEESLAVFEELMYQKEMEFSALEFQIEAYKYELLRKNPFAESNDATRGEKGIKSTMRRVSSMPSLLPTDFYKTKSSGDGEKHATPMLDSSSSIDSGNLDLVHNHGLDSRRNSPRSVEFNSYREQMRILDEKVKEIHCKEFGEKKLPKIKVKPESRSTSPSRAKLSPKCQKIKTCEDTSEKPTPNYATSSKSVHDVFDVHCKFEAPESSEMRLKNKGKSYVEEDDRLKKPDLFTIGSSPADDDIGYKLRDEVNPDPDYESPVEYDTQWVKLSNLPSSNNGKRSYKPSDESSDDCKSTLPHPSTRIPGYRPELQLLAQRLEQLESRRTNTCHEISEGREDELNLLMHLREQLDSIQSEMRSWRLNKSSPSDEVSLLPPFENKDKDTTEENNQRRIGGGENNMGKRSERIQQKTKAQTNTQSIHNQNREEAPGSNPTGEAETRKPAIRSSSACINMGTQKHKILRNNAEEKPPEEHRVKQRGIIGVRRVEREERCRNSSQSSFIGGNKKPVQPPFRRSQKGEKDTTKTRKETGGRGANRNITNTLQVNPRSLLPKGIKHPPNKNGPKLRPLSSGNVVPNKLTSGKQKEQPPKEKKSTTTGTRGKKEEIGEGGQLPKRR
ncbi:hypothetical protein HRI_003140600 [Hibiscus trionum]|uniref:GTD-binding domain-containing protein n=1 Tax=Hibiscus trionum TaxID=183268 RepID=A0A9W7MAX1_HIBTR|nr:hypothetical protein HRI_003140600 [Hibiscus trionum]